MLCQEVTEESLHHKKPTQRNSFIPFYNELQPKIHSISIVYELEAKDKYTFKTPTDRNNPQEQTSQTN